MQKKLSSYNKNSFVLICLITIVVLISACSPVSSELQPTEAKVDLATMENQDDPTPKLNLDLREANVLNVSFEKRNGDEYLFEVTLIHDDDGESPNFADAWQVDDEEGLVLGTRILLHSHGNQPFTRSETITIPEGITVVVVRGHDMLHGYGGQSMRVDMNTGEVEAFFEDGD